MEHIFYQNVEHLDSAYFVEYILKPFQAQVDVIWPGRFNHKA